MSDTMEATSMAPDSAGEKFQRMMTSLAGRFGVVTALPEEFAAMCVMLDEIRAISVPSDPNEYRAGKIPVADGSGHHPVIVTLLKKAGNNSAAAAASHLSRSFPSVEDILMVGIAGGCPHHLDPGKHVRLGDLVISNEYGVIQYDQIKLSEGKVELRDTSGPPSAAFVGKVRVLEADRLMGKRPWEDNIGRGSVLASGTRPAAPTDRLFDSADKKKRLRHPADRERNPEQPKVHYGRVGAANTLLKDPKVRDALRDQLNIRAIEMEGSGIADGAWIEGKSYILIRGICDYCDAYKNDLWHGYAAVAAAAYARALIAAFPAHASVAGLRATSAAETAKLVQFLGPVQGAVIGDFNHVTINSRTSE